MIRIFDIAFSLLALVILSPLLVIIYLFVSIESTGGSMYIQNRVGKNGIDFKMYKFRSMFISSEEKGSITLGRKDPRITRLGYYLRRFKLDELPQLYNVFIGDMSLVGPRPEVRKYVNLYSNDQSKVLSVRPGITDYASIEYVDENVILGSAIDPEKVYINEIMPDKIRLNMRYIENQSIKEYFRIIYMTFLSIVK